VAMVILMLGLVRLAEEYPRAPRRVTILIVGPRCRAIDRFHASSAGSPLPLWPWAGFVPLFLEEIHTYSAPRKRLTVFVHVVYVLLPGPGPRLPRHGADLAVVDHRNPAIRSMR